MSRSLVMSEFVWTIVGCAGFVWTVLGNSRPAAICFIMNSTPIGGDGPITRACGHLGGIQLLREFGFVSVNRISHAAVPSSLTGSSHAAKALTRRARASRA
jgi:hypothetical protein